MSLFRLLRATPALLGVPAVLGVLAALAACSTDGQPPGSAAAAMESSPYLIGSGDKLSINVYDNPQLSESVPVRPDGRISIPLIQDVVAQGKTPEQLGKEIQDKLKTYVKDPNVTVVVEDFVGPLDRQVRVIGEATDPAAIPYRDGMTLLDVMVATKGLTKYAAGNRAVLVRTTPQGSKTYHIHLDSLMKDGDISQNMVLQPGDTLIIPQSWF
jgi:polysaccharide biosynthesis/export protein